MDEKKKHTLTEIVRDTLSKFRVGKQGNILVLLPIADNEDIALVAKDAAIVVSMYKKPKVKEGWKITDTYVPILINTKQMLSEVPSELDIVRDKAVAKFEDGTIVKVGISRDISKAVMEEASAAILAIPEETETAIEVTPFSTHTHTDTVSAHSGKVVVGNDHVLVRYESEKTGNVRIKSRFVMDVLKSVAKTSAGEIGISTNSKNVVVSTNTDKASSASDVAQIYVVCANYSDTKARSPEEVIKDTEEIIGRKDAKSIMTCKSGIKGLIPAMKSVITKYSGSITAHILMELSKDSAFMNIKDNSMEVERKVDLSETEIETTKGVDYPFTMLLRISVARYLLDLSDDIREIRASKSGKRKIIVLTTDKESAIFAA